MDMLYHEYKRILWSEIQIHQHTDTINFHFEVDHSDIELLEYDLHAETSKNNGSRLG